MPFGAKGEAAIRVQRALNVALDRNPPLIPDGDWGNQTTSAMKDFQVMIGAPPTGNPDDATFARLEAQAVASGWLETPKPGGPAPWMAIGRSQQGVAELSGIDANPKILGYISTFRYLKDIAAKDQPGLRMIDTDETAWCACFVHWCLLRAGQRKGPSAAAKDWQEYGVACTAVEGAITVIQGNVTPGTTASGWHVGFLVRQTQTGVVLLGGNQGNRVSEQEFSSAKGWQLRATRWPS